MSLALRVIDVGSIDPHSMHALYVALAEAPSSAITLLVAQTSAHYSLGASQYTVSEIDLEACRLHSFPVIQRPIGGGTVWVDEQQLCFFLILSGAFKPSRPTNIFDAGLAIAQAVYAALKINVERAGKEDLWCNDKKILGSGAASIGASVVFASSFLMRFDAARFVQGLNLPHDSLAKKLEEILAEEMVDMQRVTYASVDVAVLKSTLITATKQYFNTDATMDYIQPDEWDAVNEIKQDWEQDAVSLGRRLVKHGIKIKQGLYAFYRDGLTVLLRDQTIDRLWHEEENMHENIQVLVGHYCDADELSKHCDDQQIIQSCHEFAQSVAIYE